LLASVRGKLTRIEQHRAIAAQFMWNPSKPLEGRGIIFIFVIVVLIAIAFCLGFITATVL